MEKRIVVSNECLKYLDPSKVEFLSGDEFDLMMLYSIKSAIDKLITAEELYRNAPCTIWKTEIIHAHNLLHDLFCDYFGIQDENALYEVYNHYSKRAVLKNTLEGGEQA